jgi:NADP-dependent 3-hydroxy acid dehydrogenase YdfG
MIEEIWMSNTIVIVGFGPGVSTAVAERFGAAGFSVALIARNRGRLDAGIGALRSKGIAVAAFPADAADPIALRAAIEQVRTQFGAISVVHWNAYGGGEAGDLAVAELDTLRGIFDVAIVGLVALVQELLPDLRSSQEGAILVTNGAYGDMTTQMDEYVVSKKVMGIALANAAKSKLVGLLAQRLKRDNVYVGEVTIAATVRGSAFDQGDGTIAPSMVAEEFWKLYRARHQIRARINGP